MKASDWNVRLPMLRTFGYSCDPRTARSIRTSRHIYVIHYVLSGKGYFNGVSVEAGQGFIMRPYEPTEYYPDESDPWSYLWFTSSDASMEYFLAAHAPDTATGIFQYHNISEVRALAKQLKATTQFMTSSMQIAEYFLHVFNRCVNTAAAQGERSGADLYYDFAVKYIQTNLHLPLSVDSVCRVTGVTQPYLYKIFKERQGMSVKSYITACKLAQAERLLEDAELSISEIGASVGFSNVLAFSKFFAHNRGVSPTNYRSRYR